MSIMVEGGSKNKTVLLIFPGKPQRGRYKRRDDDSAQDMALLPLSHLCIAEPLRQAGYNPVILDQRVESDPIGVMRAVRDDVLWVGFSTLTGNTITYGFRLAEIVRQEIPTSPLVWGGVHPTLITEQTLGDPRVDIIVRREGEATVGPLSDCIASGDDLSKVLGISFKRHGHQTHTPDRPYIDFDNAPRIPYELLNLKKYDLSKYFNYQSSRGCPWRCSFCDVIAFHGRSFRAKSPERILRDLEEIVKFCDPEVVDFTEDFVFNKPRRMEEVAQGIIDRGFGFKWKANCRADFMARFDQKYLDLMKRSGCCEIYVGVESGSANVLKLILKDIKVEQIRKATRNLADAGILMTCNFLIGFPGETMEDIWETIRMYDELRDAYGDNTAIGGILLYAPYPGSEMYHRVIKEGFKPPASFDEWGKFVLNDVKHTRMWYPKDRISFIQAVSQATRHGLERPPLRTILGALARVKLYEAGRLSLRLAAYYRWKYKFFRFPVDAKLMAFGRKYLVQVG